MHGTGRFLAWPWIQNCMMPFVCLSVCSFTSTYEIDYSSCTSLTPTSVVMNITVDTLPQTNMYICR